MTTRTRREYTAICILCTVFFGFALYGVMHARTAVRDDLRRQDITNLKRALEQYYNVHNSYISAPGNVLGCTHSSPDSWFFGEKSPIVTGQFIDAIPHDVREQKGYMYTYCATINSDTQATGFYLQAMQESEKDEGVFFDEDEQRKFDYRILKENGKNLYRVCGGEELQCKQHSL